MEFNELIDAFAAKYGLADLKPADGAVALDIDGIPVVLTCEREDDFMTVYAEIGLPPPDANGPFGQLMLRANHLFQGTDGAVLCQNPETGAYAMFRQIPLASADLDALSSAVEKIVNSASEWKQIVGGFRVAEEEAEKQASESPRFDSLSSGPFLQV